MLIFFFPPSPFVLSAHYAQVWTVEPGVYFNSFVFENAFANATLASMLVKSKIDSYANFGGVRIEDTLVITATGSLALSSVPKTVKDVERLMKR